MRTRMITVERLEAIARTALTGGYGHLEWWRDDGKPRRKVTLRLAMDCENPVFSQLHARYSAHHYKTVKPLTVDLETRCRKCVPCKERRRMFWRARAVTEYSNSFTTLFGTLTIAPEQDAILDARARLYHRKRGVDFDRLPEVELFRERVKFGGQEITKYLKRLREGDKARGRPSFRYLLIAEAHNGEKTSVAKRGRPHWHILLHEQTDDLRLVLSNEWRRYSDGRVLTDKYGNPMVSNDAFLKSQWLLGYSSFYMASTPQAASYLCKYLTKDASARVRASFRYGGDRKANETLTALDGSVARAQSRSVEQVPPPNGGGKNEMD